MIDVEKHGSDLNSSKIQGAVRLIDPIQKDRNAAAAVIQEKFNIFTQKSKEFLKKPTKKFFNIKTFSVSSIKNHNIIIKPKPMAGKEDIVGCKLMKAFEHIQNKLKDFDVTESGWYWDKGKISYFWYTTKTKKLEKTYLKQGPPLEKNDHVKVFKKLYKDSYVKNKRLYVKVKRKHTKLNDILKEILKDKYLKQKARGYQIV
jgi:tRNA nucleotidyltransferase (CCA-adding enzyme)